MGVMVKQVQIVAQDELKTGQLFGKMALFDSEGEPVNLSGATTTAADAPDGDADSTIANTKFVLKNAGKNKTEIVALTATAAADPTVTAAPAPTATAAADAVAAVGVAPTKEEFDAVVTLANELKADLNVSTTLVTELKADLNATVTLALELKADLNAVIAALQA